MGLGDSRSLFSSFSSFPQLPPLSPLLDPPSTVFNIKVRCLTGVSPETRALLLGLPPTDQEREELVNPCSLRKEDEGRGKGPGQNWLFYNLQKR